MHQKFKAVVFDFGGVIEVSEYGNPLYRVAEVVGVSMEDFQKEYFNHNHLSNVQGLPWEETVAKVAGCFTDSEEKIQQSRQIILDFQASRKINQELTAFFPRLREQGYKVAIFSNANADLRQKLTENGIIQMVDEVVISGEIGFQKPHKEAFEVLFDRLNLQPHEVVFIDDVPKSLEKAGEIGYNTPILYRENDTLKEDLKGLGISL